jgi:hypothetical protein
VLITLNRENPEEFLVYKRKTGALFRKRYSHFPPSVTHHSSRKQFFAKLLGVAAAMIVFPKVIARSVLGAKAAPPSPSAPIAAGPALFKLQADVRAVPRRDDTL